MTKTITYNFLDGSKAYGCPSDDAVTHLGITGVALKDMPKNATGFTVSDGIPPELQTAYNKTANNAPILNQLFQLDSKKIRAISDALLTGDNTRLLQLEQQAILLRPHLK